MVCMGNARTQWTVSGSLASRFSTVDYGLQGASLPDDGEVVTDAAVSERINAAAAASRLYAQAAAGQQTD